MLPKLPTVALIGAAMTNAAVLKCAWSANGRLVSGVKANGSPTMSHRAVTPGVNDGVVLVMPAVFVLHEGVTAVPLRNFVTPDTCQSPRRRMDDLVVRHQASGSCSCS